MSCSFDSPNWMRNDIRSIFACTVACETVILLEDGGDSIPHICKGGLTILVSIQHGKCLRCMLGIHEMFHIFHSYMGPARQHRSLAVLWQTCVSQCCTQRLSEVDQFHWVEIHHLSISRPYQVAQNKSAWRVQTCSTRT